MVVLDETGVLLEAPRGGGRERNKQAIFDPAAPAAAPRYRLERGPDGPITDRQRLELSARIRRDEIYAFVEIPANVLDVPLPAAARRPHFTPRIRSSPRRRAGSNRPSTTPSAGIGSGKRASTPMPSIAPALGDGRGIGTVREIARRPTEPAQAEERCTARFFSRWDDG